MRLVFVFIVGVLVAVLAYVLISRSDPTTGQASAVTSEYETDNSDKSNLATSADPTPDGDSLTEETEQPKELVSSIYDYGLDYREKAVKAVEDRIQHYPSESYNRWGAIRVDPYSILNASYLEEGAMPKTISVTPFPDVSFVADQTSYTILEDSYAAIWTGKIRGSDNGQIRVSILGVFEIPTFVILVSVHPRTSIRISPATDHPTISPDMYMAVEANPNLEMTLD